MGMSFTMTTEMNYEKLIEYTRNIYLQNYAALMQSYYREKFVDVIIDELTIESHPSRALPSSKKFNSTYVTDNKQIGDIHSTGNVSHIIDVVDVHITPDISRKVCFNEDVLPIMDSLVSELYLTYESWVMREAKNLPVLMRIEQDIIRKFNRIYKLSMSQYGDIRSLKGVSRLESIMSDIVIPPASEYVLLSNTIFLKKIMDFKK